jgi:hypothetical protein
MRGFTLSLPKGERTQLARFCSVSIFEGDADTALITREDETS